MGRLAARLEISVTKMVPSFFRAVEIHSLGDRIAVDAKGFGRVGDSLFVSVEGLLNVELFKFSQGLIKHDVTVEHFFDYGF